jgi:hypothetical protein
VIEFEPTSLSDCPAGGPEYKISPCVAAYLLNRGAFKYEKELSLCAMAPPILAEPPPKKDSPTLPFAAIRRLTVIGDLVVLAAEQKQILGLISGGVAQGIRSSCHFRPVPDDVRNLADG